MSETRTFELSDQEAQLIDHLRAAKQQAAPEPPAEPARRTWGAPGVQAAHEAAEATVAVLDEHERFLVQSDDELTEIEKLSLYIIGCQALHYGFKRSTLEGEGQGENIGYLWHETTNAILAALPSLDTREIDAIGRAAAEK
jgi:hypothetical protein